MATNIITVLFLHNIQMVIFNIFKSTKLKATSDKLNK